LNIHHPVFQDIFKYRDEKNYLAKTTFNSIKQLNIADCSDDDMLTDEQIHILFPNVIHANASNEMTESELRVGWDGTKKIVPWDNFFRSVPWDGTINF